MLTPGIRGEQQTVVNEKNVASAIGSGALPVFSTPMMIALMELTAAGSVQPFLDEGQSTVGTRVDVQHTAATPLGMIVRCESELIAVDGKRLTFSVSAFDACGSIGSGVHERYIIDGARFLARANAKQHPAG